MTESDLLNVLGTTAGGGCFRWKDSREVFENSEGVGPPREGGTYFLLVPRLKNVVHELSL